MNLHPKIQKIFEIPIGKHIKISLWLIPLILCAFSGGYIQTFLCAYFSAFLHELAHILCAKVLKVKISQVTLYPFGICGRLNSGYIRSSEKEFFIAAAGPFASLILFWVFTFLHKLYPLDLLTFTADANLALCTANLIPILPLDGGRIFKAMLTSKYGIIPAYNFMCKLSKILVIFLFAIAIAVFILCGFNFSLILISAFLIQNLCSEQKALSHITAKEILQSDKKIQSPHSIPVKALCVSENSTASHLLRHLSYDCYYIVYVLDKDSRLVRTLTETQILTALTNSGIRTRYSDIK